MAKYIDGAVGDASHREGTKTSSYGYASHAEGDQTQSIGKYSHAEGSNSVSTGENSHAQGSNSVSFGENSHAEGSGTLALGKNSHAEGSATVDLLGHRWEPECKFTGIWYYRNTTGDLRRLWSAVQLRDPMDIESILYTLQIQNGVLEEGVPTSKGNVYTYTINVQSCAVPLGEDTWHKFQLANGDWCMRKDLGIAGETPGDLYIHSDQNC